MQTMWQPSFNFSVIRGSLNTKTIAATYRVIKENRAEIITEIRVVSGEESHPKGLNSGDISRGRIVSLGRAIGSVPDRDGS